MRGRTAHRGSAGFPGPGPALDGRLTPLLFTMKHNLRRQHTIVLSLFAVVLVFLLACWFFWAGSWSPVSTPAGEFRVDAPKVGPLEPSASADRAQELEPELSGGVPTNPRPTSGAASNWSGLATEIPANLISEVRRNSLNRDGTISDTLKELLFLSPRQVSFLNQHIQDTAGIINEREFAKLRVIRATEQVVVLHIPALPDSDEIEAEFRQGVLEFLGETDGQLFLDLIESSHLGYLDAFGRFDRTMTFTVEPRDDGRFRVEFRQESPPEQVERHYAERGMGISGAVGMGRSFGVLYPSAIAYPNVPLLGRSVYLLDLLPDDVRSFFEKIETGDHGK